MPKLKWTDNGIEMALADVATGKPLRSVAGKYGMNEGTLRYRFKKIKTGKAFTGSGRRPFFEKMATCIDTLCKLGFSPTMNEVISSVSDYIKANNIIVKDFKDGKPGRKWFVGFMDRNHLSLNKVEIIKESGNRKSICNFRFLRETG